MKTPRPYRIPTIDDNPAIHEDFRNLFFDTDPSPVALDAMELALFGASTALFQTQPFVLDSASQG